MSTTSLASTIRGDNGQSPDGEKRYDSSSSGKLPPYEGPGSNTASDEESQRTPSTPQLPQQSIEKPESEPQSFEAAWEENDPENPKNWSTWYKSWITFQLGMIALAASLGSSIISPAEEVIAEYVGVSTEVTVLLVSLYVLGFACGPLMWAPISEIWGRRVSLLPPMVGLLLFSIGVAESRNAATIFICRFFSGVFGSAPVSNVSAAIGDIWSPAVRGTAVSLYAVAVVGGPTIGPVVGSALTNNPQLGWRWTGYILAIWVGVVVAVLAFCMPEIYAPVLLKRRAQKLRLSTGDERWHHPQEDVKIDPKSIVTKHFSRPLNMLATEPMVTCIALYASFVYAILYLTLEVFPIVYAQHRHWGPVVSTLPFLALFVGVLCALGINLANQPRYKRIVAANNGRPVPEARLLPMILGGWLFVIGLFMFGWTGSPAQCSSWVPSVIAAAFIGAGFNVIFQQCINFLVDTYALYAASAVSANTFLRSLLAAGLPLAAKPMFRNLGIGPAMSILGAVAALALPVPWIFMKYGLRLRRMSKFAPVHD